MPPLSWPLNGTSVGKILCLGAHSDDIEIGAGGTILQLLAANPNLRLVWVVFSGSGGEREREACRSASLFLESAKHKEVIVKGFRNGFFPYDGKIKEFFEELKLRVSPDLIFTHYRDDRHQDHRTICDLTWNTWRNHMILEYEIPKYDGDLGSPNWFVPLRREICGRKIKILCDAFQSQRDKTWFTEDTFQAILRLRGVECAAPDKYAEAFYCRKFAWNFWASV